MEFNWLYGIYRDKGYIELKFFPFALTLYHNENLGTGIGLSVLRYTIRITVNKEEYF